VKTALKLLFDEVTDKIMLAPFLWLTVYQLLKLLCILPAKGVSDIRTLRLSPFYLTACHYCRTVCIACFSDLFTALRKFSETSLYSATHLENVLCYPDLMSRSLMHHLFFYSTT